MQKFYREKKKKKKKKKKILFLIDCSRYTRGRGLLVVGTLSTLKVAISIQDQRKYTSSRSLVNFHLKCISWNAIELLFSFPVYAMRLGLKFTLVECCIAGNFREHKFPANHQKTRQLKNLRLLFSRQGHDILPHPLQFSACKW